MHPHEFTSLRVEGTAKERNNSSHLGFGKWCAHMPDSEKQQRESDSLSVTMWNDLMQCSIINIHTWAHGTLHHHSWRLLHCLAPVSPRRWAEAKNMHTFQLSSLSPYTLLRLYLHVSHQTFLELESGKEYLLQPTSPLLLCSGGCQGRQWLCKLHFKFYEQQVHSTDFSYSYSVTSSYLESSALLLKWIVISLDI